MYGFLTAKGLDIECLGAYSTVAPFKQYNNTLNKFPDDQVLISSEQNLCFLDGYVYNKEQVRCKKSMNWQNAFCFSMETNVEECLKMLRGGFCGYYYNKKKEEMIIYTDQVSVQALYYYVNDNQWIISNNITFMISVLKANHCIFDFNEVAAKYMLTYGYMLDDSTFVKQIHRLLPGHYAVIKDGKVRIKKYHFINRVEIKMSEQEAVERIDSSFRSAVKREFEKDREYGYQHLVDLSGGLDSRMVSWVAHDLGYIDQVNIAYSRAGYIDESVSKEIACFLQHEYIFKTLDDAKWLYDIDDLTSKNNGAALYTGITGGDRLLARLRGGNFGIEHTGMIGDAILSTFYQDRALNCQKPRLGLHRYSEKLAYEFNEHITEGYPDQEMFAIYTRGILGAQSSYMIRQQYFETASPFMDVDFLDTVFSIPFEYRVKHHIYLKWMQNKYPRASDFGWEKWGGIKPKESHILFRKIRTTQRLVERTVCRLLKKSNKDSMNPEDYWYDHSKEIQEYLNKYFIQNMKYLSIEEKMKIDMEQMFYSGNVTEKSMVLTVLAMAKKVCDRS